MQVKSGIGKEPRKDNGKKGIRKKEGFLESGEGNRKWQIEVRFDRLYLMWIILLFSQERLSIFTLFLNTK